METETSTNIDINSDLNIDVNTNASAETDDAEPAPETGDPAQEPPVAERTPRRMFIYQVRTDRQFELPEGVSTLGRSHNGTRLNGKKIEPETAYALKDGDVLRLADEELVFHME